MERVIQAIKAAKVFAAKKDIRYYFNGVALFIRDGKIISVVATNGYSMCVIGVNPALLADLEKSRKELIRHLPPKDRNFIGVVMKFGSPNDVISFEYTSEKVDPCIVCISPMRL